MSPPRRARACCVDRETGMVTLFSEPENEDYLRLVRRSFGDPLSLPEPFAFELDTTDLV
ncbi:hypothetical protein [Streptomyces sp. DSM 118148]|uniref:hypothetical protein n=1 Tax=Streptomyces sp. DSM 118148 TaxID=3448667 RepID=UPI0040402D1B